MQQWLTADRFTLLFMGLVVCVTLMAAPDADADATTAAPPPPAGPDVEENGPSSSFLPVAVAVVLWRLLER